jgi:hypothetical protein
MELKPLVQALHRLWMLTENALGQSASVCRRLVSFVSPLLRNQATVSVSMTSAGPFSLLGPLGIGIKSSSVAG